MDSFVRLRAGGQTTGALTSVEVLDPEGRRPLSLSDARTAQTLRLDQAGFYQLRLANGRDAVIGVNPDRRESDLEPMPEAIQKLWSRGNGEPTAPEPAQLSADTNTQRLSLWWWVMLLALVLAVAEKALGSAYMGVQREEA